MNCDDVTGRLAGGEPLDAPALEHLAGCAPCCLLLQSLDSVEAPDPEGLAAIKNRLAAGATPVKPLPSDRTLVTFLTGLFVLFSFLAASAVHMGALHVLTPLQMGTYFGVITGCALAGAFAVVGEMIPGSKLRIPRRSWMIATAVSLVLICVILFRSYDTRRFVQYGMPCLSVGSVSALAAGLLLALFMRTGFVAFRRSAARIAGFLAALAGVSVLALHCSFLSVAHILVWHFGVLFLGWLVGDLIGRMLEPR